MGSDHYGLTPDIITIAKGLTSAYAPLSGSIVSDDLFAILEEGTDRFGPFGHGWTYSAHPIGAAAGVANLKLVDSLGLVANAREMGGYFRTALAEALAGQRFLGDLRGEGLLAAVELQRDPGAGVDFDPAEKITAQIVAEMARRGVIARAMPQGEIIGFAPPLCLTRAEADTIISVTKDAITAVTAGL
jgi:L-2,4-diaminobutyrate transaminase